MTNSWKEAPEPSVSYTLFPSLLTSAVDFVGRGSPTSAHLCKVGHPIALKHRSLNKTQRGSQNSCSSSALERIQPFYVQPLGAICRFGTTLGFISDELAPEYRGSNGVAGPP